MLIASTATRTAAAAGKRPVLTHVGRRSGRTYRTPLDAHPVEGGYVFVLVYGPGSDWARNVDVSRPPKLLRINAFLRMDVAG
ncbi:PNPOx family protein [Actinophytocola sp. KF-1]